MRGCRGSGLSYVRVATLVPSARRLYVDGAEVRGVCDASLTGPLLVLMVGGRCAPHARAEGQVHRYYTALLHFLCAFTSISNGGWGV